MSELGHLPANLNAALTAFPEDDERHWLVQAYLFNLLAHKAQKRADEIRRKRQREQEQANASAEVDIALLTEGE